MLWEAFFVKQNFMFFNAFIQSYHVRYFPKHYVNSNHIFDMARKCIKMSSQWERSLGTMVYRCHSIKLQIASRMRKIGWIAGARSIEKQYHR